ncbi:MAG: hypothetical protein V1704_04100 [Candidatus Vogelbacteria bacterium]
MARSQKFILFTALALIVILYALMNSLRGSNSGRPLINKPTIINYNDLNNSRYEIPISDSPMDFTVALTSDVNTWPTYRNEQFGFSLKYPPGWGVTNEKFKGDTWFIGFSFSPHDFFFGMSITRDSLEDKITLEKGTDFLRMEEVPDIDGVKIVKIFSHPTEYSPEISSYVFENNGYSFAFRIDPEFFRLILPTLHFF